MTPINPKECCEKCADLCKSKIGVDGDYEWVSCCVKLSCECHQKLQGEEWETEFRRLFGSLQGKTGLVIDHIHGLLSQARSEAERKGRVEELKRILEKNPETDVILCDHPKILEAGIESTNEAWRETIIKRIKALSNQEQ